MSEDLSLDLADDDDLALFLLMVPDWLDFTVGLDLETEQGKAEFRQRLSDTLSDRVAELRDSGL